MGNFKLVLQGFNSEDEVEEFLSWYSNSGEQDFGYHLKHSDSSVEFVGLGDFTIGLYTTTQNLEVSYKDE